ncbi:MAG TPA: glycosyltransferase family 4 protein [Candidatus Xenobia bacterium]|jgi:glycosyltransferase involved in cell wall biosynthesis
MKIAILSLYLPSGSKIGVGYQVHYLANALTRRGHDVTVYSQSGPPDDARYPVVVPPIRRHLRTFRFAWDLRAYDFSRYDVVHACGDDWFLWGKPRRRLVHTYMGSCLAEMFHASAGREKLRMAALAACETTSSLLADCRVAISENTRRFVPNIQYVIPCGIDIDAFRPNGPRSTAPSILFVGTMHGRKRGYFLQDIFIRHVRPHVPDAELWMVCEEPAEGPGIVSHGRVGLDHLIRLYRQAWVFCLPSTYEGFGVPYIEAMAAGAVVVASPNLGAKEVTGDGRFGLLAADHQLAEMLTRTLQDEPLRHHYQTAGLAHARDYGWERVCQEYEQVYAGDEPEANPSTTKEMIP